MGLWPPGPLYDCLCLLALEALSLLCLSLSLCLCLGYSFIPLPPLRPPTLLALALALASLCDLSSSVSLLLSLPLPPHILSCLWGTGNLGDQRDTRKPSRCCLEIMRGAGALGWTGQGSPEPTVFLPALAHTDTEELCHSGPQSRRLWTGPDDPRLGQGWRKNQISQSRQGSASPRAWGTGGRAHARVSA